MSTSITEAQFRAGLLEWYARSHRPLPWKEARDPYVIWLSEIILQQTRVEQGLPYFRRFLERFPTVQALADAPIDVVLKAWEGLGYYSRARNLHATARRVAHELGGRFPDTYDGILALKGVGPYTAAAIASFAFDLPFAVVDGNVFRVLARVFGIDEPIDRPAGKSRFSDLAQRLLDREHPGRYNQAIMDFGATHCTPRNPNCLKCPFRDGCAAHLGGRVDELPLKTPKQPRRERFFHYLVLHYGDDVFLHRRDGRDIWQGLYELPLIEREQPARNSADLIAHPLWTHWLGDRPAVIDRVSRPFRQTLSHQTIMATFWTIILDSNPQTEENQLIRTNQKNLSKFALPRIIDWYLQDNSLYLKLL